MENSFPGRCASTVERFGNLDVSAKSVRALQRNEVLGRVARVPDAVDRRHVSRRPIRPAARL